MQRKYILFLLFAILLSTTAKAQSQATAKALYDKGEYDKAKPALLKLIKQQPSNGNYNLWYGVCCLKTGKPAEGVKYLETAVKRKIPSGQVHLAQAYNNLYRFEEAAQTYEDYIADLAKRKRPIEETEALLEKVKGNLRMLKGVEEVCFIDSIVVDKQEFLKAYKISSESGKLFTYDSYFKTASGQTGTVYETELSNKIYYSEKQPDGTLSILSSNKLLDSWSKGSLLPGSINKAVNANFPFVMADGLTIYYAADGAASMGGYDIFVTRYNTNTDSYLTPENVGMPFNSPYNDYMYVVDEFNNLGWFASDRYQPQGKVCIYVFIPNNSKQVYNYEGMDATKMMSLAKLQSIKDTWKNKDALKVAKERLAKVGNTETVQLKTKADFDFIIDDQNTYHLLSDFRSPQAQTQYGKYALLEKSYKQQLTKLAEMRAWYARASKDERNKITPAINDLEKTVLTRSAELDQAAIQVRNLEKQTIK